MLRELERPDFDKVRSLFDGFDYSLSLRALMAGNSPGRIFVDNTEQPRTAFALTVEGYLLAGDSEDRQCLDMVGQFLRQRIFTGEIYLDDRTNLTLAVCPQSWEDKLLELIPTHEVEKLQRYYYLCTKPTLETDRMLPAGYRLQRMTAAFLDDPSLMLDDSILELERIGIIWGSVENFLQRGIGFCIMHEQEVVSCCYADCVEGEQIDIGVVTHPDFRRRGLAKMAVAATVEYCLAHGFTTIGWHCNAMNIASWKTAEKVGFERNREFAYYYYIFDPVDHLAELGWHHYQLGNHEKTRRYYERVFAAREENPDYYYYLAACVWGEVNHVEKAGKYLLAAADSGWSALEHTLNDEDLSILHGTLVWEKIINRIEANCSG